MAATTALSVLALLEPGARVAAVANGGYWGTMGMLRSELGRWGLEVVTFENSDRAPASPGGASCGLELRAPTR